MNKNLIWNVFIEDPNKKQIVTYNVLNKTIVEEIINRTLGVNDKDQFAEEVKHIIMYYYWSRSEWEVVIVDWPPHITNEELNKLNLEQEKYYQQYGKYAYSNTFSPTVGKKVDVYDQVNLNWNIFIDYLWNNLR